MLDRERRATERRIKAAKFPVIKSLDTYDFLAIPSLNKKLVVELARVRVDRPAGERAGSGQLAAPARPTSAWRWDWRLVSKAFACGSPPRRRWCMS